MDGIHDLGGKMGHGAVDVTDSLPGNRAGFTQRWHAQVFASLRALPAAGALKNTDQFRHAVERIDPAAYLSHGYYGRWLGGIETLLAEAGVLRIEDIDARAGNRASAARPVATPPTLPDATQTGGSQRLAPAAPRFVAGDRVRAAATPVAGHTRLPAYARGKLGVVVAHHDAWVLPDTNAHGDGECPTHLYTVMFRARELWGKSANAMDSVRLDLFETYLEPDDE